MYTILIIPLITAIIYNLPSSCACSSVVNLSNTLTTRKYLEDRMNSSRNNLSRHEGNRISEKGISKTNEEDVTVAEKSSFTLGPGILNSFENVTYWAQTEETIFILAKARQLELKEEIRTLKEQKVNHQETTKLILQQYERSSTASVWLRKLLELNSFGSGLHDFLRGKAPQNCEAWDTEYSYRNNGFILPHWPNQNDLDFAMHSLTHTQEVYNFDYKYLPIAMSPDTRKPPQLLALHCSEIGTHALLREHYAVAIEWIEHAIDKVTEDEDNSFSLTDLETNLELAVDMHNEAKAAEEISDTILTENLFLSPVQISQKPSKERERTSTNLLKEYGGMRNSSLAARVNFNGICSGRDFRTLHERSALYCWYDKNSSPARTIMPYKKELISFEPEVIQVYDFMGDKLISSLLKNKIKCSWIASVLGAEKPSFFKTMRIRTASNCWPNIPELESLWKKISDLTLTDLRNNGSHSPFQTLNYLFGRFHGVHMDALRSLSQDNKEALKKVSQNGDRIISMIFYMNDVAAGGSTAFPFAGTAALPVKGSVVLWKNLYRNGSARIDTWHGGCPVLYGHKQSGTVHLYLNSQFLSHPCTLNSNE